MRTALNGVPEQQMPMPDGLTSIDGELYYADRTPGNGFVANVDINPAENSISANDALGSAGAAACAAARHAAGEAADHGHVREQVSGTPLFQMRRRLRAPVFARMAGRRRGVNQNDAQAGTTVMPTDCWWKRCMYACRIAASRARVSGVSSAMIRIAKLSSRVIPPLARSRHWPCVSQ